MPIIAQNKHRGKHREHLGERGETATVDDACQGRFSRNDV